MSSAPQMRENEVRGQVCLGDLVTVAAVYDPRERWNSFLCPRMTREAVETVMQALAADAGNCDPLPPSHHWENDVLVVTETDGEDVFTEALRPDAEGLYPLGARAMAWTEDTEGRD